MINGILENNDKYKNIQIPSPLENMLVSITSVCNLKCVFCVHRKSNLPNNFMSQSDFRLYIDKAIDGGYDSFNLTPNTGEPTIDPLFCDKLEYLETKTKVNDYCFSTNLTLVNENFFKSLVNFNKLRCLSVSIYGHDENSFKRITAGSLIFYKNLINNLRSLLCYPKLFSVTELKIRTTQSFDFNTCDSELCSLLRNAHKSGIRIRTKFQYSNWGGQIQDEELEQAGLKPKKQPSIRAEPCVFIFFNPALLVDGSINACACADGMAQLVLGNLRNKSLREIYSFNNPSYLKLLHMHFNGSLNGICQKCSEYHPISTNWHAYAFHRKKMITVNEFIVWLKRNSRQVL